MIIRRLEANDYFNGYLQLLEQLTVVQEDDEITFKEFSAQIGKLDKENIYIIENNG